MSYYHPAHANHRLQQGSLLLALPSWNNPRQTSPNFRMAQAPRWTNNSLCVQQMRAKMLWDLEADSCVCLLPMPHPQHTCKASDTLCCQDCPVCHHSKPTYLATQTQNSRQLVTDYNFIKGWSTCKLGLGCSEPTPNSIVSILRALKRTFLFVLS